MPLVQRKLSGAKSKQFKKLLASDYNNVYYSALPPLEESRTEELSTSSPSYKGCYYTLGQRYLGLIQDRRPTETILSLIIPHNRGFRLIKQRERV